MWINKKWENTFDDHRLALLFLCKIAANAAARMPTLAGSTIEHYINLTDLQKYKATDVIERLEFLAENKAEEKDVQFFDALSKTRHMPFAYIAAFRLGCARTLNPDDFETFFDITMSFFVELQLKTINRTYFDYFAGGENNAKFRQDSETIQQEHNEICQWFMSRPWSDKFYTQNTVNIARTIYETKNWTLEPILADALMDAGYEDEYTLELLKHQKLTCIGVWILDQLLGKRNFTNSQN